MADVTIFPRCSKSAVSGDPRRRRRRSGGGRLHEDPARSRIERIVDPVPDPPSELVRKDDLFKELGLGADDYDSQESVVEVLLEHPMLMQRPVVIRGDRAVIGRPPENVKDLLD